VQNPQAIMVSLRSLGSSSNDLVVRVALVEVEMLRDCIGRRPLLEVSCMILPLGGESSVWSDGGVMGVPPLTIGLFPNEAFFFIADPIVTVKGDGAADAATAACCCIISSLLRSLSLSCATCCASTFNFLISLLNTPTSDLNLLFSFFRTSFSSLTARAEA
jgi:hypothetical protein